VTLASELRRQVALPERDERPVAHDLTLLSGQTHDLYISVDRFVERHSGRENGDQIHCLLCVRIPTRLDCRGFCQVELSSDLAGQTLEPEWQMSLHDSFRLEYHGSAAIFPPSSRCPWFAAYCWKMWAQRVTGNTGAAVAAASYTM
jgi:hypothetical protein